MKIDQYLTINLLKCPITDTLAGLYITRYPQWKYLRASSSIPDALPSKSARNVLSP